MRFAGDEGDFLESEHEADAEEFRGSPAEEAVVEAAAATEAKAFVVERDAGDDDAIEFRERDARAAERVGLAQAKRTGHDDVIPRRDLVPVEFGR